MNMYQLLGVIVCLGVGFAVGRLSPKQPSTDPAPLHAGTRTPDRDYLEQLVVLAGYDEPGEMSSEQIYGIVADELDRLGDCQNELSLLKYPESKR